MNNDKSDQDLSDETVEDSQIKQPLNDPSLLKSPRSLIFLFLLLILLILGATTYLYFRLQPLIRENERVEDWWPKNRKLAVVTPSPTPTPWPIVDTSLGQKYSFKSNFINLSFEYPIEWGNVEEFLRDGETGKRYDLTFNGNPGGSALGFGNITAGGRTKDFTEGRGGYIADAADGFSSSEEFCNSYFGKQGISCEGIALNIVIQSVSPKFEDVCPPAPGSYWFSKRVWINLANQEVDGFMLEYSNFWSDQFEEMKSPDLDCFKTDKEKFEAGVLKITNKLKSGDLDEITKENLGRFDAFVESIKIY